MKKLSRDFYNRDSVLVAQELLGKILVHKINGGVLKAKIVETEAYMGIVDKAAHSHNRKKTPRIEVMYGDPGFSYVYLIYGIYNCFNVVASERNNPHAVLIRAIEPIEGIELMSVNRYKKDFKDLSKKEILGLGNGPGKLCMSLSIDRNLNGEDLRGDRLWIEDNKEVFNIVTSKRIGIGYAEEAIHFPYRYYIDGNPYVSRK